MGLGERSARHDTLAARQHQGVRSEIFADFHTGQRVRTVDGVPGVVAAVEDGPYPGTEAYRVELDHGLGGGLYRSGDLSALTSATQAEASTERTAETDYPELGSILRDRPDPARDLGEHLAARHRATPENPDDDEPDNDDEPDDGDEPDHGDDEDTPGGGEQHPSACSYCGGTDFKLTEHTGRSIVAQCQSCGGTMSSNGGQWTPELIGDPGNHPSEAIDPASGAQVAPVTVRRDTVTNERLSAHGDQARSAGYGWGGATRRLKTRNEDGTTKMWHGTQAELPPGAYVEPGSRGNYNMSQSGYTYFSHSPQEAHGWARGGHVYEVRPLGEYGDDPGSPHSFRSSGPLEVQRRVSDAELAKQSPGPPNVNHHPGYVGKDDQYESDMGHFDRMWADEGPAAEKDLSHKGSMGGTNMHTEGAVDGPDWCTHRRGARCYYPGDIAHDGSLLGIPQDRGPCPWDTRWAQQVCPISEASPMALMQTKGTKQPDDSDASRIVAAATRDPEFRFEVTAAWADVRNKAKRLRREGGVRITSATVDTITGEVKGDHHIYETQINYVPGSSKLAHWQCGCRWAAFTWGRSPKYRRFEGRSCSHSLALQFEAQQRGMFGRDIEEDTQRPPWMRHHTPVVIKNDRDGDIDSNWTRRSVPPGNMRRTWGNRHDAALDVEGIYPDDHGLDLARSPLYALAADMAEHGHPHEMITAALITAGLDPNTSQNLVLQAHAESGQQRAAATWRQHPGATDASVAEHLATSLDVAGEPAPHRPPQHAARWNGQQPWEELLAHAAAQHQADAASHDHLREFNEGWPTKPPPHSDTENPASTGWAASEDPPDWGRLPTLLDAQQPSWEASLHHRGADEEPETQLDYDALSAHEQDKGGITPHPNMDTYRNRAQRGDVSWQHPMDPHRHGPIWNEPGQRPEDFEHLLPHSMSVLHEHPEPALPTTEGDDHDDEQHDHEGADLFFSLDQSEQLADQRETNDEIPTADHQTVPNSYRASRSVDDTVARFQASRAGAALGGDSTGSSQAPHGESDIVAAARAHLGKTALKNFTPAEQAELLGEKPAGGDGARNRDRLQLEGTHYEALDGAHSTEELLRHLDDLFL